MLLGVVQLNAKPLSFVIDAPGTVLSSVVVTLAVDWQPPVPVTVTVKMPAVLTVIEADVSPVDHAKLPLPVAVKIVDGVVQVSARPLSAIAISGIVFGVAVADPAKLIQPFTVCVTV